jgi:hypothetical protein
MLNPVAFIFKNLFHYELCVLGALYTVTCAKNVLWAHPCLCLISPRNYAACMTCSHCWNIVAALRTQVIVGSLFYYAFSVTRLYSINNRVISEWWWIGKDLVGRGHGLIIRYYPGICLEGQRKTMKNLSQDSWLPGQRLERDFLDIKQLDHDIE